MKRLATLSAALVLASAAGFAQAGSQISSDDFSTLTGPQAHQVVSSDSAVARGNNARDNVMASARIEDGLVGPGARIPNGAVTRAQVVQERELARAQGLLVPGADYLTALAAPNAITPNAANTSFAGSPAVPAGQ